MDNIDNIIERIKKAVRLANKTTEAERKAAEEQFKRYSEDHKVRNSNIAGSGKSNDDASLYHGFMMADRVSLNRPCEAGGMGEGAAQVGRQVRIGMCR